MSIKIKIIVGVMVFLGIVSGIYLLLAKKAAPVSTVKPTEVQQSTATENKTPATSSSTPGTALNGAVDVPAKPTVTAPVQPKAPAVIKKTPTQAEIDAAKKKTQDQWQQCKAKSMPANTAVFWSVQISEGIPVGGTYAKGTLGGDATYPVRVTVKADSSMADQIKQRIVVGKSVFFKGNCIDVSPDGAVVIQAS